jgi:hypothetical protein
MNSRFLIGAATLLVLVSYAPADTIVLEVIRTGTDTVDWSQLGPAFTPIPNPFSAVSSGGVPITGTFATGTGEVLVQSSSWNGNFAPGDFLVWTMGNGPLTLDFGSSFSDAGAQIQADFFGAFTAVLSAFNGATLLGSVIESGISNSNGDNSAIFIGVNDLTGPNITRVVFSIPSCSTNCTDFAINRLSLSGPVSVPEPASLLLVGSGLLVAAAVIGRKSRNRIV